ncbi:o-succinylbenzoate synthase, partial [Pantoea sp. SIMBA_133]
MEPIYNEETVQTNWHMMIDHLIPLLSGEELNHPDEVSECFKKIRGNYNAKAAIECAIWDLYAKINHMPLAKALGGVKKNIEVGVS